jgi:hypothetical protein
MTADFGKDAVACRARSCSSPPTLLSVASALLLVRIVAAIQAMQGRAAEAAGQAPVHMSDHRHVPRRGRAGPRIGRPCRRSPTVAAIA